MVASKKLRILTASGDQPGSVARSARMSYDDWRAADIVLLYDDRFTVVSEVIFFNRLPKSRFLIRLYVFYVYVKRLRLHLSTDFVYFICWKLLKSVIIRFLICRTSH